MFLQPKRKLLDTSLNPGKPLVKDKGYVSVIKHFNPYLSKNSSKDSKLPFPEVITDSNETTESKVKDYIVSKKKKNIKYSRINNSTTTKSKLNVLSSARIIKPKDNVYSSNAVKSISLVYKYPNRPTELIKRRNTTLFNTKKKIPEVTTVKKEVNIKQTSVSPVIKLELEQRMFKNAEKLKTKSQNLPKKIPIHKNKELDKTSVVLNSIPVAEISPRNNNLKCLLPLNLSPRGVSTRADLLKDEINTERIKKLVYQNEEIKNLNIVSKRRIIAELKTEIAEFRNKGLYVFNLNIKNNFKSPRSKSLKSKSDRCDSRSPRRSKDDSSIDYSKNSSDKVLTAVSVYKKDSLSRSETDKNEFSTDFSYLTDRHTNLDKWTGSPRGNKDNLAGLQKNFICLQAAVRPTKRWKWRCQFLYSYHSCIPCGTNGNNFRYFFLFFSFTKDPKVNY